VSEFIRIALDFARSRSIYAWNANSTDPIGLYYDPLAWTRLDEARSSAAAAAAASLLEGLAAANAPLSHSWQRASDEDDSPAAAAAAAPGVSYDPASYAVYGGRGVAAPRPRHVAVAVHGVPLGLDFHSLARDRRARRHSIWGEGRGISVGEQYAVLCASRRVRGSIRASQEPAHRLPRTCVESAKKRPASPPICRCTCVIAAGSVQSMRDALFSLPLCRVCPLLLAGRGGLELGVPSTQPPGPRALLPGPKRR